MCIRDSENLAVPEEIAPYPNAEEFVPKMGNSELELWEIDAPKNLWNIANARRLLGCYNAVSYTHLDVYKRQDQLLQMSLSDDPFLQSSLYATSPQGCPHCLLYTSRCV